MQAGKTDRDIEQEITNLAEYRQNPPAAPPGTAAPAQLLAVASVWHGREGAICLANRKLSCRAGERETKSAIANKQNIFLIKSAS